MIRFILHSYLVHCSLVVGYEGVNNPNTDNEQRGGLVWLHHMLTFEHLVCRRKKNECFLWVSWPLLCKLALGSLPLIFAASFMLCFSFRPCFSFWSLFSPSCPAFSVSPLFSDPSFLWPVPSIYINGVSSSTSPHVAAKVGKEESNGLCFSFHCNIFFS